MRTVKVNDQGQIMILEAMREALAIKGDTVLVLLKRGDEIVLRREEDVLRELEGSWRPLQRAALEDAWDDEDAVWDAHHQEERT